MDFCNLFSGSSGNSTYISTDSTKILIDAGVSCSKLASSLAKLNTSFSEIAGILISHEHTDHVKGLEGIVKKYNVPIYATSKTWKAMRSLKVPDELKKTFSPEKDFLIGDILVLPFLIPHDAVEPCAFSLFNNDKKITVATDLGFASDDVLNKMLNSDLVLIEANYDADTLRCGHYPYALKMRIQSETGHMSNFETGKVVRKLYENGTTHFVLGHLSKENNFPELAYQTVLNEVKPSSYFDLSVAKRDEIDNIISI